MATLSESDSPCLTSRSQAETDFAPAHLAILDLSADRSAHTVGITIRSNWLPTAIQRSSLGLLEDAVRSDPAIALQGIVGFGWFNHTIDGLRRIPRPPPSAVRSGPADAVEPAKQG